MKAETTAVAKRPVRVLVVDDSAVARGLIARMLESDSAIKVVGSAANGKHALQLMPELSPDLVVLDIHMPVMDGLTALPKLLACQPNVKVIVASTASAPGTELSVRALELGAAECISKPARAVGSAESETFRHELVAKVRTLVRNPRPAGRRDLPPVPAAVRPVDAAPTLRAMPRSSPAVLAIGSSTGGPQALMIVLGRLASQVKLPILLTQHMPPKFTTVFAEHITKNCGRPCIEPRGTMPVEPGRIYLAPGNYHLKAEGSAAQPFVALSEDPPENYCRPAVDVMFRSIARVFGSRTLGIILTGIGTDGTRGAAEIVGAGGAVLAQDEASSVVWGMPGSAARAGLCSALLPPAALADRINILGRGTS